MTTKQIEELATNAVRHSILTCDLLDPYISENDKGPSWDGFVYIYSEARKAKQDFRGRVPVQVKGHECEDLSMDVITHPTKTVDLNCYLRDGGVIYFVTYIAQRGQRNQIYYASLTSDRLCDLLDNCTVNQESKTITLEKFPEDENARTEIFRDFEKQYRPNSHILSTVQEEVSTVEPDDIKILFTKELVCQRLSADPENRKLIDMFSCKAAPQLAYYLKYFAWEEDIKGETAYYLIKEANNNILMFFSLKCGSLFSQMNPDGPINQTDYCRNLFNVDATYPAVELVHMCINDEGRTYWKDLCGKWSINCGMGEMLFWLFVAPTVCSMQKSIGCQFVYTYVADSSQSGTLVSYYQERMNFRQPDQICTTMSPYYAYCTFMYQEINSLWEDCVRYIDDLKVNSGNE